jgi:hypothetical protein
MCCGDWALSQSAQSNWGLSLDESVDTAYHTTAAWSALNNEEKRKMMRDPTQCFESASDGICPGHYSLYVRNAEDVSSTSTDAWRFVSAPAPIQFVTI